MSTVTAIGARTVRTTGTNARMLTAQIGTKASRTKPLTSTTMMRTPPVMSAATSARSRRPPMSTATATGARTARAIGTNAPTMTARTGKKASRTRPRTSTTMMRTPPVMSAAMSAPSHQRPSLFPKSRLTRRKLRFLLETAKS